MFTHINLGLLSNIYIKTAFIIDAVFLKVFYKKRSKPK